MDIWTYIIVALVSSLATSLGIYISSAHGTLRIDTSNPEKDIFRLDIDNIAELNKKKTIFLTVDKHSELSHK